MSILLSQKVSLVNSDIAGHKLPKTQYLGSKERLVDWICDTAPKNVSTVFDAFSGTSSVGYAFKIRGKKVIGNDFLKFNYHIGRALIQNNKATLDETDVALLLATKNNGSQSLMEEVFTDVFFERSEAQFLDVFRSNVCNLENETKKSLALAIMCRALTRKIIMGHFAHTSALRYSRDALRVKRNPSIVLPLRQLFLGLINDYNKAVFNNGKRHRFYCEDAASLAPKLSGVDLAYFDPPYCGRHPDYESFYHLLETFVEYWTDKSFINGTRQYSPKKNSGFVRKTEIISSFERLFESSKHIPYWLISYNDKSYPEKDVMTELISKYKQVRVHEYEYKNNYGGKGSRMGTKEYLFYCFN